MTKQYKKEYDRKYYLANRDRIMARVRSYIVSDRQRSRVYQRNHRLKTIYKISKEAFFLLLLKQENKCAICKVEFDLNLKPLTPHVDHDHVADKVRGLLCQSCNTMLGMAKDSVDTLNNAVLYLNQTPINSLIQV